MGALVVFPPTFLLLSDIFDSSTVSLFRALPYDSSLGLASEIKYSNFWEALGGIGGALAIILFGAAVLLVLQRVFGGAVVNKSEFMLKIGGTVAVSAVVMFVLSFMFNPFSDLRMILAMCFVLGLCGAVYKVGKSFKTDYQED